LPLTPEETELYAAYHDKENAKARKRWDRIRASEPPMPEKLTTTEVLKKYKEVTTSRPKNRNSMMIIEKCGVA